MNREIRATQGHKVRDEMQKYSDYIRNELKEVSISQKELFNKINDLKSLAESASVAKIVQRH